MGKKDTPDAPDPYAVAGAQTRTNIQTAIANTIMGGGNQVTPWGSQSTDITGWKTMMVNGKKIRVPITTTETTLTGDAARGNNASMAGMADLAQMGRRRLDSFADSKRTMTYGTDFSADRQRVEDAIMGRMQPGLDRDRAQLEQRLADQGIAIGSEPYQAAMDDLNRGVNDARLGAVMQGGQEQSRMVGLERDRAAFENQTRDARFNEIMTMLSGGRAQMPQFGAGGGQQMPTTDMGALFNNQYQGQMNAYNAKQQQIGGLMGGLASLFALSDRRAKTDIRRIGTADNGLPIYLYRYKSGGPMQIGLMADDVEKVTPEAVIQAGDFKMVNYGKALEDAQ